MRSTSDMDLMVRWPGIFPIAGQVGQSGPLSGLDPQQPYSPAAPLTRPPGLDPDGPTFPSPRKLVAEGLDPTEVGTQTYI
jgi:hypothetical protein